MEVGSFLILSLSIYLVLKRHNLSVPTFMPILGVAIYSGLSVVL